MAYGKKNVIKVDPFSYNIGIIGEGGVGKTTVIFELCKKHLGDDGYLFAECGKEDGADAINSINYVNCPDWMSDYDELNNAVGFCNLIDDIIENKETDYPNLRVLVVDTYDQLRKIVEPEVIKLNNKQYPDKQVKSIKAAFGGYMAGDDMCDDMILDKLWELKKVGVHFIAIGHVKTRDIDDFSGVSFTQLTTDMSMRSFNKLKTKLHFLGVALIDREIVSKQRNEKKSVNVIKSEARKITFRDDNFAVDSKSRFADIAEECELNADALYKTLCDAIEKEAQKSGKSLDELKKEQADENKKRKQQEKEYSKLAKENKVDLERNEELIEEIKSKFMEIKSDDEKAAPVKAMMKELGVKTFTQLSEKPTKKLEEILAAM